MSLNRYQVFGFQEEPLGDGLTALFLISNFPDGFWFRSLHDALTYVHRFCCLSESWRVYNQYHELVARSAL